MAWCLVFLFCLPLTAKPQFEGLNEPITLNYTRSGADKVIREMDRQSNFFFTYSEELLSKEELKDIHFEGTKLSAVLESLTRKYGLHFLVKGKNIAVSIRKPVAAEPGQEQRKGQLTGTVTDNKGTPLPGASVRILGPGLHTGTDQEGNFSFRVAAGRYTIEVSYLSYKTQRKEISVEGGKDVRLDFSLDTDESSLSEVVVVGYGTQKKGDVTGSVTSIKAEDFTKGAIFDPMQLIQGKVAGLMINNRGGTDPNSTFSFQLRGISSITAGANPLVVVDGVPVEDINVVAPEDIAAMDILKDGSAAAIYGTRGNNGVILISTKRGRKDGNNRLEYSGYVSTETVSNRPSVLSADEYRAYAKQANIAITDLGASTNWFDELVKTPVSQVHNLSYSGGSLNTSYRVGLTYKHLDGIMLNTNRKILNGRVSIDHRMLNDRLSFQLNTSQTTDDGRLGDYTAFEQAMWLNPTAPITLPNGNYWQPSGFSEFNPVARLEQVSNKYKSTLLNSSLRGTFHVIDQFSISVLGGLEKKSKKTSYWESITSKGSIDDGYSGKAKKLDEGYTNRTFEMTFNYNQQFGDHQVKAVGGYSYQDFENDEFSGQNMGFITDAFGADNIGAGSYLTRGQATLSSYFASSKLISFFGRVNYGYRDKYLVSASLRHEGSSKFGKNNKWGNFPSASFGWRLNKESFMAGQHAVNDLKLRFGYGITGNQDITPYQSLTKLNAFSNYPWQGGYLLTYAPSTNPNPDLRWEKKAESNLGVDLSVLNYRLNATLDLYKRTTTDLLYLTRAQVPSAIYSTTYTNIGKIENKGIELTLNAKPVQTKAFKWDVDFNFAYNKNKLVSLAAGQNYADLYEFPVPGGLGSAIRMEAGQPLGNFYGKEFDHLTENGKWVFKDHAGDGANVITEKDKTIIGNGMPNYFLGLGNRLTYKNFDLSLFFRAVLDFDIVNGKNIYYGNKAFFPVNVLKSALASPLSDDRSYSSYYVEKGDYVKLDNFTLGYNFPLTNSKTFKTVRVYVTGNNLLTITGYSGLDPELELTGLQPGIDTRDFYPKVRTFTLGVNVVL